MDIRQILVPVDFSEKSEAAVRHAFRVARRFNAGVILAHVIEAPPMEYRASGQAFEPANHGADRLSKRLRSLGETAGEGDRFEPVLLSGDPANRIEHLARDRNVDFVVLPTHGHGAFRRMLLGSVTAKVLHDLTCPVLTGVHMEEQPPFPELPYRRLACALGLREKAHSEKVLRWAHEFAQAWEIGLTLIHTPPAIDWGAGEWFPADTQDMIRRASEEKLNELVARVGCEADIHINGVEAAPYIEEVIAETGCDLLVVGRSVDHGLFGGGGTNAYSIIRGAPCPVISV